MANCIKQINLKHHYIIGQDSNTQVGIDSISDKGEYWNRSIRRFGLEKVSDKRR